MFHHYRRWQDEADPQTRERRQDRERGKRKGSGTATSEAKIGFVECRASGVQLSHPCHIQKRENFICGEIL